MSKKRNQFASPPCFAHEYNEPSNTNDVRDEECWRDVQRWRISQRKHLLDLRKQLSADHRKQETAAVTGELDQLILSKNPTVVGVYWPIYSEMNLLHWLEEKTQAGLQFCLPVVSKKKQPLKFYDWKPGKSMVKGEWGIPVPSERKLAAPNLIVVPVLGADSEHHRLGYGGGYYDRTLAKIDDAVFTVGVGFSVAKISTIFPQPHDVSLKATILG